MAAGEGASQRNRGPQAAGVDIPAAGKIERGAMIDGGADDGQAQRHVDAAAKARVLQNRQALVVVHREDAIEIAQARGIEQRVRRQRTCQLHALRAQARDERDDDLDFLASEMAGFTRMGIQARDRDARLRQAEAAREVALQDAQRLLADWRR